MSRQQIEYGRAPETPMVRNRPAIPWWVGALVIAGALLTAMGAGIALVRPSMLASPQDEINGAVHIYAGYLAARNLALALMLVGLLALGARRALGIVMALVAFVQILDICMDCAEGRWTVVPVVLLIGVSYSIAATRLLGGPLWRRSTWIDK